MLVIFKVVHPTTGQVYPGQDAEARKVDLWR